MNGIRPNRSGNGIDGRCFFLAIIAWILSACAEGLPAASKNGNMHLKRDNLELVVEMKPGEEILSVFYLVRNRNNSPLFLFNILHERPGPGGVYEIDEGGYVEVGTNETVISRKQLTLPFGVLVESKIVPFVTRVPPGGEFKETFKMPLPLSQKVYYEDPEAEQADQQSKSVPMILRFELGYFFGKPGTDELAKWYATSKGNVIGFNPFPVSSQKIISVGPFPAVPVIRPR